MTDPPCLKSPSEGLLNLGPAPSQLLVKATHLPRTHALGYPLPP